MSMKLFGGVRVAFENACPPTEALRATLVEHGAQIVKSATDEVDFVIVDEVVEDVEVSRDACIIGEQCVYDSVLQNQPLPTQDHPVLRRTMESVCIGVTSSVEHERDARLVRYMNGVYEVGVSARTTHVIASSARCPEYAEARRRGLPVLRADDPSWIESCWTRGSLVDVGQFVLPPFADLIISVTGLEQSNRMVLRHLVETLGGEYSPDLKKSCTHLIAERPSGVKYKYARSWGLKVVTTEWLFESVNAGRSLDAKSFSLSSSSKAEVTRPKRRRRSGRTAAGSKKSRLQLRKPALPEAAAPEVVAPAATPAVMSGAHLLQLVHQCDRVLHRAFETGDVWQVLRAAREEGDEALAQCAIRFIHTSVTDVSALEPELRALLLSSSKRD